MLFEEPAGSSKNTRWWCPEGDSNPHVLSDTATSTLRVYQFRHLGITYYKVTEVDNMVERTGVEPVASALRTQRSPN